jgi:hypothetical protein
MTITQPRLTAAEYHKLLAAQMSEAELQTEVIKRAEAYDWKFYHPYSSRKSVRGYPDLTMVHRRTGRLIFAELKRERCGATADQREWLKVLQLSGALVVLWKPRHLFSGEIDRTLKELAAA